MGKVYYKYVLEEKTIGYYKNGEVYEGNPSGLLGDISVKAYYDSSSVRVNNKIIASWDKHGFIKNDKTDETIAKCDNGMIYVPGTIGWTDSNARYDGDMFGAAATAAVFMFNLGSEKADNSVSQPTQVSSSQSGDDVGIFAIIGIIVKILLGLLWLVWVLFPIIPAVLLFASGTWPLGILDVAFIIAGWFLYRSNKKKPSVIKVFFAEGMQSGGWVTIPVMLIPGGIEVFLLGCAIVGVRVAVMVIWHLLNRAGKKII